MKKFRKGQIVYMQGWWKSRIVEDDGRRGGSVSYVPLEGYAYGERGKMLTASKSLFKTTKRKK